MPRYAMTDTLNSIPSQRKGNFTLTSILSLKEEEDQGRGLY
jgi:hypothetical protein